MLSSGAVCVALVVTRHAIRMGLPLDAESLLTGRGGQILDLGRRTVQSILVEYGVTQLLAVAGGRTSRGNIHNMRMYVAWLNQNASSDNLHQIEQWWVATAGKTSPFQRRLTFSNDPKESLRKRIANLLEQAMEISKRTTRIPCVFQTVLQHLVGAKLELVLGREIKAHGAFVADSVTDRPGDYQIEDVVIHVTASPGEALLRKCGDNLNNGLRPLIITTYKNMAVAETLAENAGLSGRVEFFDVEQFVVSNIYELSKFNAAGRQITVRELITRYNRLAECENNPGLLIRDGRNETSPPETAHGLH